MVGITLSNVSIEFPLYSMDNRLLRQTVRAVTGGGRIARDTRGHVTVRALKDISLTIREGDRIGLIGQNGAGKTTLLRALAGVYKPTSGTLVRRGRVAPLFDLNLGLDMEGTGYENIIIKGLLLGLKHKDIRARLDDIASFTELGDHLAMPVRTYSSGMLLRLSFAVCTAVPPEIILMDEWLGVGDAHFLRKATDRLKAFVERSSVLVLASHSESLIRETCNKCLLLNQGQVVAFGPTEEVLGQYRLLEPAAFFDAGRYLAANPDIAAAAWAVESPWSHFISYGWAEVRDLGNGIHLAAFSRDPVFIDALVAKDADRAVARLAQVAPYLPGYVPPPGRPAPAANNLPPPPVDFVPQEGQYLILPAGAVLPKDPPPPPGLFRPAPGTATAG